MSLDLKHEPAAIVKQLLVDKGFAVDSAVIQTYPVKDWTVWVNNEPEGPDNVITVYDTQASSSGRDMISGHELLHRGIQFRIRSADPRAGGAEAELLRVQITTQVNRVVTTVESGQPTQSQYRIAAFSGVSGVLTLGREMPQSRRNVFTINALCAIERLS